VPHRTFPLPSPVPRDVVVGDFNGDGRPDLAVAGTGSNAISVVRPSGPFGPPIIPAGTRLNAIATADFNGDGKLRLS
jgi:hypothetical protein